MTGKCRIRLQMAIPRGFDKGSITFPKRFFPLQLLRSVPFFHGGNTGSNPVGDAKSFQAVTLFPLLNIGTKKAQLVVVNAAGPLEDAVFSH